MLSGASPWRVMAVVFLVALVVRWAYVLAFRGSPFFSHLVVDAQWHDEWARALAAGTWSPHGRAFFRAPLYPVWLSLLYRVFGHDLLAIRLVQGVVGASTAAAVGGAATRMAGRRAGWIAGLLAAFYGPLVFFDGELLIPNLLLALLSWALFLLAGRVSTGQATVSVALLGLAAVARPNALFLLPAACLWVLRAGPPERRRRWKSAGLLLGLGLLPAIAVTAGNARVEGTFVFIASQDGVNLFAGNNPQATGRGVDLPEMRDVVSWREFVERVERIPERAVGRPLSSREVDNWWRNRALSWIASHPGKAAALTLRKAYYLVNAYEIPNNRSLYRDRRGPLRWLLWKTGWFCFPWGLLFPLAVMGLAVGWRDARLRASTAFLAGWVALYALSLLPFFVNARFRLGLLPAMLVLAGFALARPRALGKKVPLIVGLVALVLANSSLGEARRGNPAQETARLAAVLVQDGRVAEALPLLEEARREDPRSVTLAYQLAEAYARAGRPRDALPLYEEVAGARPSDPVVRLRMARQYLKIGRYERAGNILERVVRLDPGNAAAWADLGYTYEERGRKEEADSCYARAAALTQGR